MLLVFFCVIGILRSNFLLHKKREDILLDHPLLLSVDLFISVLYFYVPVPILSFLLHYQKQPA